MKKIVLIFILLLINNFLFSQSKSIEEIEEEYSNKIEVLNNNYKIELKTLQQKDYVKNKEIIKNKYDKQINLLIKEKNAIISSIKDKQVKIKQENEKSLFEEEQKKQKYEQEIAEIEKEKRLIEKKKKLEEENEQKRIAIEKEKVEIEKQKRIAKEKREFENSDYGKQITNLKTSFSAWLQKDEFEDQNSYLNRINNNYLSKFNELKDKSIIFTKKIEESTAYYCNYWGYDINSKLLTVRYRNIKDIYNFTYKDSIQLNVSPEIAKYLKSKSIHFKSDEHSYYLIYPLESKLVNNNYKFTKFLLMFPQLQKHTEGDFFMNNIDNSDLNYSRLIQKSNDFYIKSSSSFFLRQYLNDKDLKLYNANDYINKNELPNKNLFIIIDVNIENNQILELTPENLGFTKPTN